MAFKKIGSPEKFPFKQKGDYSVVKIDDKNLDEKTKKEIEKMLVTKKEKSKE